MKEEWVSVETKTGHSVFLEMRSSETEVALSMPLLTLTPSSSAIDDDNDDDDDVAILIILLCHLEKEEQNKD